MPNSLCCHVSGMHAHNRSPQPSGLQFVRGVFF
jgi:hypothetical protein